MPNLPIIENCFGCATCIDSCAQNAILLIEDPNGFYKPLVDKTLCVDCGLCEKYCPSLQTSNIKRHPLNEESIYAAWSTDKEIIHRSASGGVFGQVAKVFLEKPNTVAYGATLTEDTKVKHIAIDTSEQVYLLQNSKYQQSNASGIYREVKKTLKENKQVLFSGTPCQIAGLYCYLGNKDYDNLFTAEVLCHGVPTNYLAQLALKVEDAKQIVQYRTKSQGWAKGNRTVYKNNDGSIIEKQRYRLDFHFRSYLSFRWLRQSCNHCPFAQINRVADITMGDFWGVNMDKYPSQQGVSLLLVNSQKGQQLISGTKDLCIKEAKWEDIYVNQNCYMPTILASKYSHLIHKLKLLPTFLQKVIFQRGFTNKWLFGIGQICQHIIDLPTEKSLRRQKQKIMNNILHAKSESKQSIGILTTYFAANFGAMLQPYALLRVLENMGYNVSFIKYKQQAIYNGHRALSIKRIFNNGLGSAIGNIFALPFAIRQDNKMQAFKRQWLKTDDKFDTAIPSNLNFYIFGSDQIWNPKNTNGFDKIYFGEFEINKNAKKITYAASGEKIEDTPNNRDYLEHHLKNFDAIGVREPSLKEKLEKMTTQKGIEVVLDPTLLATKDILDELPSKNIMKSNKYVFFYQLRQSANYLPKIYQYAQDHGWKLLIVSSSPKKDFLLFALKHKDVIYLPAAGMEDFLGGIKNAECVFTPSFHGNVFATVYHKPLFSMTLGDGLDTRAHDLLVSLKMENRIISLDSDLNSIQATNYAKVDSQLDTLRQHSMQFLVKNLKQHD